MSGLDLTDFDLFMRAIFGNPGEQSIAVKELLKRDARDVARLQRLEVEQSANQPKRAESGQSGDRPSRLKG